METLTYAMLCKGVAVRNKNYPEIVSNISGPNPRK